MTYDHLENFSKIKKAKRAGYFPKSLHTGLHLSETEKADIRRRMRNFEAPKSIAKFYGITLGTVMKVNKSK
jgi:hypothetical protein